jgi:hypothetical protein
MKGASVDAVEADGAESGLDPGPPARLVTRAGGGPQLGRTGPPSLPPFGERDPAAPRVDPDAVQLVVFDLPL